MSLNEEIKEVLNVTCIYGLDTGDNRQDIYEILKNKLLDYRLTKIKCFIKPNAILGIQFTYRSINNEIIIMEIKPNENENLIEEELILNNETINGLKVWLNEDIKLIGFEIETTKKNIKKFGYGEDNELRIISDFKNKDQIIVGFGCCSNDKDGITSIYAYYINKRYISILYNGIFTLRVKIKDSKFKEKTEKKLKKMNEKSRILYRICQLPDNQFFNIIKYIMR